MKKLLSLALALMMLCCLAASAVAEDAVVYYVNTIVMGGTEYNAADLGMNIVFTLNPDGTGVYDAHDDNDPSDLTWVDNGDTVSITINGEAEDFVKTENGLEYTEEDMTLVLTTEAPEAVNLGALVAAEDQSAFNGTWSCAYVDMDGTIAPVAALADYWEMLFGSTDTTIVVADGTVTVCGGEPTAYTFADGQLTYAVEGNEASGETLSLTDAGYLVYTMDAMSISLYCEPAAQ